MAAQCWGCALVHRGWLGVLPKIPLVFGFCRHRSAVLLLWLCASKARWREPVRINWCQEPTSPWIVDRSVQLVFWISSVETWISRSIVCSFAFFKWFGFLLDSIIRECPLDRCVRVEWWIKRRNRSNGGSNIILELTVIGYLFIGCSKITRNSKTK